MAETKKTIDRLRWLCEEAETRAREELEPDFTKHLAGLQREMEQLVPLLFRDGIQRSTGSVPFRVKVDRPGESDERYSRACEFKSVALLEPDEDHYHEKMLSSTFWVDKVGGLVSTKFFGADEIRQWFCLGMGRWVRFLTAASEKLGTSSTAAAASPQTGPEVEKQTSSKGRKGPKKTGRPRKAKLQSKQLEAIHNRAVNGESLTSIFESYGVNFSYHTFRKLYREFKDQLTKEPQTENTKSR